MSEVRFCENNFVHGTDIVMERLKKNFPEDDIASEACLGYCGDCAEGPYALVEGELVQAADADELYDVVSDILLQQ